MVSEGLCQVIWVFYLTCISKDTFYMMYFAIALCTVASVGAFLMYSRNLHLERNVFLANRGPSGYGIGLKDMDGVEAHDNRFLGNRVADVGFIKMDIEGAEAEARPTPT